MSWKKILYDVIVLAHILILEMGTMLKEDLMMVNYEILCVYFSKFNISYLSNMDKLLGLLTKKGRRPTATVSAVGALQPLL